MNNKKYVATALLASTILGMSGQAFAASPMQNVVREAVLGQAVDATPNSKEMVKKLVPGQMKKHVQQHDVSQLAQAGAYGVMEAVSLIAGDAASEWNMAFKNGTFALEEIVPIYDVEENLTEAMLIFNSGYVIVDAESGDLKQYGFGVDREYFEKHDKVYVANNEHFGTDASGQIQDGNHKGKMLKSLKVAMKEQGTTKPRNIKWGQLDAIKIEELLNGFTTGGTDEGTSLENTITDPKLWLLRYYPYKNSGISNLTVTLTDNYDLYVPEIQQGSDYYTKSNDCAAITTLEMFYWVWGITSQTTRTTAYNAIINSEYFQKPDEGVYWYNNDDIFKVAAEAIGKNTQSVSDDPGWKYWPSYSTYKSELQSYGPGYLSFTDQPYGAHTVLVKGVRTYKTTFVDSIYITRNYYDEFIHINDHWSTTDSYMNLASDNATWYYQSIKPN